MGSPLGKGLLYCPLNTGLTNLRVIQENEDGERVNLFLLTFPPCVKIREAFFRCILSPLLN